MPAIQIGSEYYSYFQVLESIEKTAAIVKRLFEKGNPAVVTQTRKGYVIWIWEPDGKPSRPAQSG